MPAPYTIPRLTTSILIHFGSFYNTNQSDAGVVDPEFADVTGDVSPSDVGVVLGFGPSSPAFTHFDAGVMQAASYDEIIIDADLVASWSSNTGAPAISTTNSTIDYAQVSATGRPFWLMVRL